MTLIEMHTFVSYTMGMVRKNMTYRNFRATERKRKKFAGNASTEIWEGERKVEEILLNWDKEKKKK